MNGSKPLRNKHFKAKCNEMKKEKFSVSAGNWESFQKKLFGIMEFGPLHLRQFFQNNLSRKAEGYGPMKPWQPYRNSHPVEGANSILHNCESDWAERDKSEIKFDIQSY